MIAGVIILVGLVCFYTDVGWASKATSGSSTGGAVNSGHPGIGHPSLLEILKKVYYLAAEEEDHGNGSHFSSEQAGSV